MVNGRSMGKPYSTSINRHSVAETEGKGSGFLAKISDITFNQGSWFEECLLKLVKDYCQIHQKKRVKRAND